MLYLGIIGHIIIGVKRQHRTGHLVHDVLGGSLEYHILKEALGKLTVVVQQLSEIFQLMLSGKLAAKEKISYLLVAETVLGNNI